MAEILFLRICKFSLAALQLETLKAIELPLVTVFSIICILPALSSSTWIAWVLMSSNWLCLIVTFKSSTFTDFLIPLILIPDSQPSNLQSSIMMDFLLNLLISGTLPPLNTEGASWWDSFLMLLSPASVSLLGDSDLTTDWK